MSDTPIDPLDELASLTIRLERVLESAPLQRRDRWIPLIVVALVASAAVTAVGFLAAAMARGEIHEDIRQIREELRAIRADGRAGYDLPTSADGITRHACIEVARP